MINDNGSSNSLILGAIARILMPVMLMASVFLLLRGHDEPGGGFLGGLLGGVAFVLMAVAFGPTAARRALGVNPLWLVAWGLFFALLAAFIPVFVGRPFFTGLWTSFPFAGSEVKLGTPLVFDIGVYLLVMGIGIIFVINLQEIEHRLEQHEHDEEEVGE